jgi:hypothetical protein
MLLRTVVATDCASADTDRDNGITLQRQACAGLSKFQWKVYLS